MGNRFSDECCWCQPVRTWGNAFAAQSELPQLPVQGKTCVAVSCAGADVLQGVAQLLRQGCSCEVAAMAECFNTLHRLIDRLSVNQATNLKIPHKGLCAKPQLLSNCMHFRLVLLEFVLVGQVAELWLVSH